MQFHTFGISRLRMATDGEGVTTLVAGAGCPLSCAYCLNPDCKGRKGYRPAAFSVETLYERVRIDSLYFEATGGGITFGGGEPLLQADFIAAFIRYVKKRGHGWHFYLETCLSVPREALLAVEGLIHTYFVDIKDMNPRIYRTYTGADPAPMLANLAYLAAHSPEHVVVRVPRIPDYNAEGDVAASIAHIKEMGFTRIDAFRYITEIEARKHSSEKPKDSEESKESKESEKSEGEGTA